MSNTALSMDLLVRGTQIAITQYRQKLADDSYGAWWTLDEYKQSAKFWVGALHERWNEDQ